MKYKVATAGVFVPNRQNLKHVCRSSQLLALKPKQSKRGRIGGEKAYKLVMQPSKDIWFEEN
jgi:hypothetical protein